MGKLILHPTEMSQWHALVNEAQVSTHLLLNESTESYLVFLLMRFSQGSQLIESVIALDFLESLRTTRRRQAEVLREVGDKSLLFCGLFPGMAKKRNVSLNYFADMGQAAYLTVGELYEGQAGLYFQLSKQFLTMQQVLRAMRNEFFQFSTADSVIIAAPDLPIQ